MSLADVTVSTQLITDSLSSVRATSTYLNTWCLTVIEDGGTTLLDTTISVLRTCYVLAYEVLVHITCN